MRRDLAWTGALVLLFSSEAHAKDSWMVPDKPVVASVDLAEDVRVSLYEGDHFAADEEEPFDPSALTRLTLIHGGQSTAIQRQGRAALPFTRIRVDAEGGYLIALDLRPTPITMPAKVFEDFLHGERLDAIVTERARLGESASPGRERVIRYSKAFLEVGNGHDESFDRPAGQGLEFLPGNDPVLMKPGRTLQTLVLFQGAPLPGAPVEAISRVGADLLSSAYTTDEHGMFFARIDRPALWLLRAVHVARCEGCSDADWETSQAAYVFASGGPGRETVVAPPFTRARRRGHRLGVAVLTTSLLLSAAVLRWVRSRRAVPK
jgi:uncharacterized GH25 family protein